MRFSPQQQHLVLLVLTKKDHTMEQPQIVKIPLEALNALLHKVAERPYTEVAQLIAKIQKEVAEANGEVPNPAARCLTPTKPKEGNVHD
jgi:hypothetical protein